jgi:hypothetical protein
MCNAQRIEIQVDNFARSPAGYGTSRGDTQGACGDSNNGFSLLINWNLFGDGVHTVRAFADGVQFASTTVTVVTFGSQFLRGESATCRVLQFPNSSTDTVLTWQESLQNFTITETVPTQGGSSNYNGTWSGFTESAIRVAEGGSNCGGADGSITISASDISGSFITDFGERLTLTGHISPDGYFNAQARHDGNFFSLFTGRVNGNDAEGRWVDIFGCWGFFELERE